MMLQPETTTEERRRQIAAATLSDPRRAMVAQGEQLRALQDELDRIITGLCSLLLRDGARHGGRVANPLIARLLVGGRP